MLERQEIQVHRFKGGLGITVGNLKAFSSFLLRICCSILFEAISKVSLAFQEDGVSISRVQDKLTNLCALLEAFKHRPGHL